MPAATAETEIAATPPKTARPKGVAKKFPEIVVGEVAFCLLGDDVSDGVSEGNTDGVGLEPEYGVGELFGLAEEAGVGEFGGVELVVVDGLGDGEVIDELEVKVTDFQ